MKKLITILLIPILFTSGNGYARFGQSIVKLSQAEKFLRSHNRVRAKKGLPPLAWSDALASSAKNWAIELAKDCKLVHSGPGENLAQNWGVRMYPPNRVVKYMWAAEERHYDYETNSCADGEVCGHYKQIVVREASEVGCGVSTCVDPGSYALSAIYVCQYDKPVIRGIKPY